MTQITDASEGTAAEPAIVVGSREQVLHLLAEAAEIEHTLMCSYLYAAFSLKRDGEQGVTPAQGQALERWRKAILDVAVEEMGHLVMVANLTVALGGRPHFARPNFPVAPGYFPSGVAVRLTGFNAETLDHFIYLERPQGVFGEDSEKFDQADYHREQSRPGLMPSAQDYATIGHLYEAIRTNLIALHRQLGTQNLFVGDVASQMGPEAIELPGVEPISDLAGALKAVDVIVEQGEGSPADREQSHYREFLSVRDELECLLRDDHSFVPAWPVADSPVLRQPPEPRGKVFIEHPQAAEVLDFACAVYGLLLRCLVQCFGHGVSGREAAKKTLVAAAIDLMHVLAEASTRLARLPASTAQHAPHAGMTFTMLRGVEPLLPGRPEKQLLVELSQALLAAARNHGQAAQDALRRSSDALGSLPG